MKIKLAITLIISGLILLGVRYLGDYRWSRSELLLAYKTSQHIQNVEHEFDDLNNRQVHIIEAVVSEMNNPPAMNEIKENSQHLHRAFLEVYEFLDILEDSVRNSTGGIDPETGNPVNPGKSASLDDSFEDRFIKSIDNLGGLLSSVSNEEDMALVIKQATEELFNDIRNMPVALAHYRLAIYRLRFRKLEYAYLKKLQSATLKLRSAALLETSKIEQDAHY